jgi:hypothetical protein
VADAHPPLPELKDVTLYVISENTDNQTDVEILSQTGAQVIARGQFKWRETHTHLVAYLQRIAPIVADCHRLGIAYVGGMTCSALYETTPEGEPLVTREQFEGWACRGADGQIKHIGGVYYHGCLNNADYRQYVREYIRHVIDGGLDGIHFDEAMSRWFFAGEGYCAACEAAVQQFLAARYTPEQLKECFGIADLACFSYRAHLATQGLVEQPGESPLAPAWWLCQLARCKELIPQWFAFARHHAQEHHGRKLLITSNIYDIVANPETALQCPYLDYVMLGHALELECRVHGEVVRGRRLPPHHSYIPMYRMATAFTPEIPITSFIDWPAGVRFMQEQPLRVQKDIVRWCTAEAYAAQVYFALPVKSSYSTWIGPLDALIRYGQFIQIHTELFRFQSVRPLPQVGVLFSGTSQIWDYFPRVFAKQQGGPMHHRQYYGLCEALVHASLQFATLFAGDGLVYPDTLSWEQLAPFSTLLLPWCYALTDNQLDLLEHFARVGRQLISVGEVGTVDAERRPRQGVQERLRQAGAQILPDLDFEAYLGTQDTTIAQALLAHLPSPAVRVGQPYITAVMALNRAGHQLYCHLINGDWGPSRGFAEKTAVQVWFSPEVLPRPRYTSVTWYSPDEPAPRPCTLQRWGNGWAVTLPRLEVWGVLVVEQENT